MTQTKLEKVIAERIGTVKLPDGTRKKVRVLIGKPTRRRGEEDYVCSFQVSGLGDDDVRRIVGYDSVQAIELAFRFVGHVVQKSVPPGAVWEDAPENMGFPSRGAP